MNAPLLTYEQAAKYLAMSKGALQSRVYQRKIAVIRFSHTAVKFRLEDLDRYISDHRQEALEG